MVAIYLVDGTLWGVDADGFAHAADVVEAPADFSQRLATSSHRLLAQSRTAINTVEVDTMGQIDKLAAFLGRGDAPLVAGTVYAGQDRAGWGGIPLQPRTSCRDTAGAGQALATAI